jgi:hypothetical protein
MNSNSYPQITQITQIKKNHTGTLSLLITQRPWFSSNLCNLRNLWMFLCYSGLTGFLTFAGSGDCLSSPGKPSDTV